MKKYFVIFLLHLCGLSLAAQSETSGRSIYRHTPEKQTRLIHTCLKVGFDFKNHPNERRETRYDKGSRLMEDKAWSYRYDAEGNLVQKISKTQSVGRFSLLVDEVGFLTWTYAWNANGSLRSASNNKGVYLSFEYDALGRRTDKINHQTQKIKRFLWDGNVPLHEWEYPLSERPELVPDSNGYLSYVTPEPTEDLTTWIFEEDGFVPIAKLQNGEKFSIFADHLGTPVMAVNSEGKRIWECELDIYGKKRKETGVPDFIPFRYQGQYEDCETGLYYNRFRYYDPNAGNYISQDPIGLAGGLALYSYVHDSNSWIDPLGLSGDYYQIPKIPGYQKHHIIPQSMKHPLLDRLGFDVHQNKNIIHLPTSETIDLTRTVHKGKHNSAYDDMILKRLDAIEALDASDNVKRMHVNDLMENVGDDLRNKRIKLNCH